MGHMQNRDQIEIEIEQINAEKARQYLLLNVDNNRNPRHNTSVKQYAADMVNGNWRLTGETLKFNISGKLFDGQNRLLAVIEADKLRPGITIEFAVARGIDDSAMFLVDSGAQRSPADALRIAGVNKYEAQKAALAKRIIVFESGSRSVLVSSGKSAIDPKTIVVTKTKIVEYVIRFEKHLEHCSALGVSFYDSALVKKMLTPTDWAFCYWLFEQTDPEGAKYFLGRLSTLEDVPETSPIRQLFRKLQTNLKPTEKLAEMMVAFEAYKKGKARYNMNAASMEHNLFTPTQKRITK